MKSAERQQRRGGGILHFLAVAERSKAKSFESKDTGKGNIFPIFEWNKVWSVEKETKENPWLLMMKLSKFI